MQKDPDLVFSVFDGSETLNVYVVGQPEDYTVMLSRPERDAFISIPKADWARIVAQVANQF